MLSMVGHVTVFAMALPLPEAVATRLRVLSTKVLYSSIGYVDLPPSLSALQEPLLSLKRVPSEPRNHVPIRFIWLDTTSPFSTPVSSRAGPLSLDFSASAGPG